MQAIIFHEHGGLEQVQVAELPIPAIGPDEVLVALKAAALNRLDLWVLAGWKGLNLRLPHIMGSDGAGLVVQVGAEVMDFASGDRVSINPTLSCGQCTFCQSGRDHMCDHFAIYGEHVPGFFTEYQAVKARNLLRLPNDASFEIAAAASLVYVTAWQSLIEVARLKAGEDVLIIGAGGGVNTACIDVARYAGARTIYVVGSSDEKLAEAGRLGAHITVNRHNQEWGKAVFLATERQGVDVVVDNVGAATMPTSLRALKKGGRLVTVGNTSGPKFDFDNRYIFSRHLQLLGSTMGSKRSYETVMNLVLRGQLRPLIGERLPLVEGRRALEQLAEGRVAGKIVLLSD